MSFLEIKTTKDHLEYWQNRKIDWDASYLQTWNHPHRYLITHVLKSFNWYSLFEIGCGAGANLVNIVKQIPERQVGGIDINADAIALAEQTFKGGSFKVGDALDIMMSDKGTDVLLSDMCLIYAGPKKIHEYIKEIKRVTRNRVLFCEFHHESLWKRWWLRLRTGYNAYDYKKLLKKHGFYDIQVWKIPEESWPGGNPQKTFGYIILAKVPRR